MSKRPLPAPPAWFILVLAAVAFALALSGCEIRLGNEQLPEDAVLIHRCPPRTVGARADVYALPDRSKVWVIYPGYSTFDLIDPRLPNEKACPP